MILLVSADTQTPIPTTICTTVDSEKSYLGIPSEHLPYLIGGCAAGVALLIIIILISVLCRVRKRKKRQEKNVKQQPKYFIPPPPGSSHIEDTIGYTDQATPTNSGNMFQKKDYTVKPSPVTYNLHPSPNINSCHSEIKPVSEMIQSLSPGNPVAASGNNSTVSDTSRPRVNPHLQGIENPGYMTNRLGRGSGSDKSNINNTIHSPAPGSPAEKAGLSKVLTHEMKRRSAQIIAMQRERNSTPVNRDSADLRSPDSVIVYDERTAL